MVLEIFYLGGKNVLSEAYHNKKYSSNRNQIKETKIFKKKMG